MKRQDFMLRFFWTERRLNIKVKNNKKNANWDKTLVGLFLLFSDSKNDKIRKTDVCHLLSNLYLKLQIGYLPTKK